MIFIQEARYMCSPLRSVVVSGHKHLVLHNFFFFFSIPSWTYLLLASASHYWQKSYSEFVLCPSCWAVYIWKHFCSFIWCSNCSGCDCNSCISFTVAVRVCMRLTRHFHLAVHQLLWLPTYKHCFSLLSSTEPQSVFFYVSICHLSKIDCVNSQLQV